MKFVSALALFVILAYINAQAPLNPPPNVCHSSKTGDPIKHFPVVKERRLQSRIKVVGTVQEWCVANLTNIKRRRLQALVSSGNCKTTEGKGYPSSVHHNCAIYTSGKTKFQCVRNMSGKVCEQLNLK